MRGGYGIYYAQYEGFGGAQYLEINPPFEYKAVLTTDSITPTISALAGAAAEPGDAAERQQHPDFLL